MEKLFVVIPLAMTGKGNKIFESGDIVSESQLSSSPEKLIKSGFIKPYEKGEIVDSVVEVEYEDATIEKTPLFSYEKGSETVEVFDENDISVKNLKALLRSRGIKFETFHNKEKLFNMYLDSIK